MSQEIARNTTHLIRYEAACKALAEARAVDEVQEVRNKADAMRIYGMQAKNKTLEVDAAEIRIRAERRLGELIREQKETVGLNRGTVVSGGKKPAVATDDRREKPTLADAGISKDLSARAQKLAAVPEKEFEAEIGQWRERVKAENARVTTRLEKAAERASSAQADEGPTLSELVDELQRENESLQAIIKASEADDLKAEAIKWRRAYEHSKREQGVAMDNAAKCQNREKYAVSMVRRCGKAVGVKDPAHTDLKDIARAVELFARSAGIPA